MRFTVSFPQASTGDVAVLSGTSRTLAPGRYNNANVFTNGKLVLTAGSYYFENLQGLGGSTISIDDSSGPVVVYTRLGLNLGGTVSAASPSKSVTSSAPLFVYVGVLPVQVAAPLRGVIVAPSASLSLFGTSGQYQGAFFAKHVEVESGVRVVYEPANALVPLLFPLGTGGAGLQECADAIKPRDDLPPAQRAAALQADVNRYCAMVGASACVAGLQGRFEADYISAAGALLTQTKTPAEYLALVRDRYTKIAAAQDNPSVAASLCGDGDADGDFIPDGKDACPNTPPLTPTDATGCTNTALPAGAPSAADVAKIFSQGGVLVDPRCSGAKLLGKPAIVAFYKLPRDSTGSFVVAGRVKNQPTGCPIWYFFEIEDHTTGTSYVTAFRDSEEVTSLAGLGTPVPPGFIQFEALPTDRSTRAQLAAAVDIRMRLKVMNGDGMYSNWSDWITPSTDGCTLLGITCRRP